MQTYFFKAQGSQPIATTVIVVYSYINIQIIII